MDFRRISSRTPDGGNDGAARSGAAINAPALQIRSNSARTKKKRATIVGVSVATLLAGSFAATNGYGLLANAVIANQRAQSGGGAFTISSPSVAGDPGGTSITETVNNMIPGDFRERLVTITPGSGLTPIIGISVSGVLNSDSSPSDVFQVAQPGDALNLLQGPNTNTTPGQPGGNADAGRGGLYIEIYECNGTWSSAAGAVAAATDDRDYTCSAGATSNGDLLASYDVPTTGAAPTQWTTPPISSAKTILIRTRDTNDGTTDGRQDPLSGEQITLTHRLDASAGFKTTDNTTMSTDQHTCVIKIDKSLWCWGYNMGGSVGNGTSNQLSVPTPILITPSNDWAAVASSYLHTCAVKTTGTLWCWGRGAEGQVGDGTNTAQLTSPNRRSNGLGGYHSRKCTQLRGKNIWHTLVLGT